jgi:putative ABC transport system permease protein
VHVAPNQPELIPTLIRQFPSITAIDTSAVLGQIRSLVEQATLAVQGVFAFTLVTGLLVLWSALQAQKPERQREIAILKSLGASSDSLRKRIWVEFLLLGGLAGGLAGLLTLLAANLLGFYLFDLGLNFNPWLVILGALLGASLVATAAWLNLRSLLQVVPMVLLKT